MHASTEESVPARLFGAALLCSLLFIPGQSFAKTGNRVEFPVWQRSPSGTLGAKTVNMALTRIAGALSGWYCYEPCTETSRQQLQLTGTISGNMMKLTERDSQSARTATTGRWSLTWDGDKASGNWSSPDGKKTFAVLLRDTQPPPFETRLVADAIPKDASTAPYVTAIRLYRDGQLVQELATDSQNNEGVFVPSFVDANFDGFPDLTMALGVPAEPNTPQQTWLYDPRTQRFVNAPDTMQGITSPEFDKTYKTIVSRWRNGCCEHGVTTYRWNGNKLAESETARSVQLPVLVGDKVLYCYTIPDYQDGRIEYPQRVEQVGDRLTLTFDDFGSCGSQELSPESHDIVVWRRDAHGMLKAVRTERVAWKQVDTKDGRRYCPETPYFANGQIKRSVLVERPEEGCSETAP